MLQDETITQRSFGLDDGESYLKAAETTRCGIEHYALAARHLRRSVLYVEDFRLQADAYVDALARTARPALSVTNDRLSVEFTIEGHAAAAIALIAWQDPDAL